jgi:hypothetical protein
MHFDPDEIGHGEHFGERCANVVEMHENAFGVGLSFAAEDFVAVDGEAVEKILFLGRSLLDETRKPGFHFV